MELVAHRAGNHPDLIAPALAVADTVELDVHLLHGRLEVRHSKVIWPFRVYWERGQGVLPDEHPLPFSAIVDAAPANAHLWVDLKGFTGRVARRVMREIGDRRPVTLSCRSWWALRRARRLAWVRTFRSVGNRFQRWVALHVGHPDGIVVHERLVTPDVVRRLRPRCERIAVWAVRDLERAREVHELGVDALILDELELIAAIRADVAGRSALGD